MDALLSLFAIPNNPDPATAKPTIAVHHPAALFRRCPLFRLGSLAKKQTSIQQRRHDSATDWTNPEDPMISPVAIPDGWT